MSTLTYPVEFVFAKLKGGNVQTELQQILSLLRMETLIGVVYLFVALVTALEFLGEFALKLLVQTPAKKFVENPKVQSLVSIIKRKKNEWEQLSFDYLDYTKINSQDDFVVKGLDGLKEISFPYLPQFLCEWISEFSHLVSGRLIESKSKSVLGQVFNEDDLNSDDENDDNDENVDPKQAETDKNVTQQRAKQYVPIPKQWKSSGRLYVNVERATNLPGLDKMSGKSDPYVILKVGSDSFTTEKIDQNNNPVWTNADYEFEVSNIRTDNLEIVVKDYDSFSKDDLIGKVSIPLVTLLSYNGEIKDGFNLQGSKGIVYLRLQFDDSDD